MHSFVFLWISSVRRRLQQIQLVKGPNRILLTLEDLTFINPELSKKVSSIFHNKSSLHHHVETTELNYVCLLTPSWCFCDDGPKKITLEDLSESKSGLEEKSADCSHSVNSMQTASHETTNVAVYEVCHTSVHTTIFMCLFQHILIQILSLK